MRKLLGSPSTISLLELLSHQLHFEGSHLGDCPICLLPLPLDCRKSRIMSCCYKQVCNGCAYANDIRELKESLEHTCPFCRRLFPRSEAAANMNVMKRVKVNDPAAIRGKGIQCYEQGDYVSAFAYKSSQGGR
mmetsp:Transcript_22797/g.38939  ORF Transcript_22797/g.38939 Transcript_22797/m.38939 type:complete len:133 (-) Transcript_22797:63-461(-)